MRNPSPINPTAHAPRSLHRAVRAFSLVEITLALGIVTFALVGVVGVIPVALASSRQSIDKNRASAIATTLYASFRSQPFQKVGYLDTDFDLHGTPNSSVGNQLDLNAANPDTKFYATFLDVSTPTGDSGDTFGVQRHLCFTSGKSGGSDYLVTMHFNNRPDGTVITPLAAATANGTPTVPAQANQVELLISHIGRPGDQYRFISVIANRTN